MRGTDSFPSSVAFAPGVAAAPADSWSDAPPTCGAGPLPDRFLPLPEVGGLFLGFELVAELGRGTFGRVFLGRQPDLAGRLVALKVSTEIASESQKLAQLQHTHIVPVYSLHRAGPLQAVCMPYFGATTLADVLAHQRQRAAPPASGRSLVCTLEEKRSRTLAELSARSGDFPAPPTLPPREPSSNLRRLEGLTHVEAVLWLGACLADGLAHAHERGIVHRDLKPANVLLTDDGQPMLLDFNLADDTKREGRAGRPGGTLPYMSPEHLAAFAGLPAPFGGGRAAPDGRSDLYALGVILFELLTGTHPFPASGDAAGLIAERVRRVPRAGASNRAVTPSVEAMLRRCLAPDPARRYASAAHLREDIHRHLDHLPLKHAREPASEKWRKWARRNPRLASTTTLAALAAGLLVLLALLLVERGRRLDRLDALMGHRAFRDDLAACRLALAGLPDPAAQAEGRTRARRALESAAGFERRLPPSLREEFDREAGEMLLLLAGTVEPWEGLRLNRAAERRYPSPPVSLLEQRARLMEGLGDAEAAERLRAGLRGREPESAADRFLLARELAGRGRHGEAARQLRRVIEAEPGQYAAWHLLGSCVLETGGDAVAAFTACVALRPSSSLAWRHRGLALLRQGRHAEAEADMGEAL
ncbi:MAG: protein kinase, partial [Gemmataceae bacterium]|nr:protein kinase [Gemmataceae bacterium]